MMSRRVRSIPGEAQERTTLTLGDICYEFHFSLKANEREDLPYLGLEDIEPITGKVDKTSSNDIIGSSLFFDSDCILFSKLRPYLNKVTAPNFSGRCSTEFVVLKSTDPKMKIPLLYLLRSPQFIEFTTKMSHGSTMPRTSFRKMKSFTFDSRMMCDTFDNFKILGQKQDLIDKSIELLSNQIDDLKKLRLTLHFEAAQPIFQGDEEK